jgi:hypothetical protein
VTSVLGSVPGRRRGLLLALPARRRWLRIAAALAAAALVGVGAVALTGGEESPVPKAAGKTRLIRLGADAAADYDPAGDESEHSDEVGLAVDGDPSGTAWATETYNVADLGKPGVGLYVDAGKPTAATTMEVRSLKGGWTFEVRGAAGPEVPEEIGGWKLLARSRRAGDLATAELDDRPRSRYYLIWITGLAPADRGYRVEISNVRLFA